MVALPVDAAISADGDAGEDADAALVGVAAELLRGGDTAVAVAEEAVDDDRGDAVPAAEIDEALVVGEEAAGRLAVGVEDADLLDADLGKLPVGRGVPGPEGSVRQARRALRRQAAERDPVAGRAPAPDQLLDAVDDARDRAAGNGDDRPGAGLDRHLEGALDEAGLGDELHRRTGAGRADPPFDTGVFLAEAAERVGKTVGAIDGDGARK